MIIDGTVDHDYDIMRERHLFHERNFTNVNMT